MARAGPASLAVAIKHERRSKAHLPALRSRTASGGADGPENRTRWSWVAHGVPGFIHIILKRGDVYHWLAWTISLELPSA
jgi:hypothetical protein